MYTKVLCLIILIKISETVLQIEEKQDLQIKCIFDLDKSVQRNIIVYFPSTTYKIQELLFLTNNSKVILNFNGKENNFLKIQQKFFTHILLISSIKEFYYFLKKTYSSSIWNPNGKYLIIYFGKEDILNIFISSWKNYIININILVPSLEVLTYFPFHTESKCGQKIQSQSLGFCGNISNFFPEKIPGDLNGCLIRAAMNLYPPFVVDATEKSENAKLAGFDLTILNAFVKRYNMTSHTIGVSGGFAHFTNGKYGGSLMYIVENISDMAFGTLYPNVSFFKDFDTSLLYHYVRFTWVVPSAKLGEQWKNLVLIFNHFIWISIIVTLICNIFIWYLFGLHSTDYKNYKDFSTCIINCWYSFLQGGIKMPRSLPMRLLIIFWVLFSLLLASLYQSQLLSILLTPVYEHQITNAEELANSEVFTYVPNSLYVRLNNSLRAVDKQLFKKSILVPYDELIDLSSTWSEKAFLGNMHSTLYYMPRNYTVPNGRQMMYMCTDEEFGNPIVMFFRKGYPLVKTYNRWLQYMLDAGLVSKWLKDATYFIPRKDDNEPRKFSLDHLSGAFFILCLGNCISTVIFIIEYVYNKCKIYS